MGNVRVDVIDADIFILDQYFVLLRLWDGQIRFEFQDLRAAVLVDDHSLHSIWKAQRGHGREKRGDLVCNWALRAVSLRVEVKTRDMGRAMRKDMSPETSNYRYARLIMTFARLIFCGARGKVNSPPGNCG